MKYKYTRGFVVFTMKSFEPNHNNEETEIQRINVILMSSCLPSPVEDEVKNDSDITVIIVRESQILFFYCTVLFCYCTLTVLFM